MLCCWLQVRLLVEKKVFVFFKSSHEQFIISLDVKTLSVSLNGFQKLDNDLFLDQSPRYKLSLDLLTVIFFSNCYSIYHRLFTKVKMPFTQFISLFTVPSKVIL